MMTNGSGSEKSAILWIKGRFHLRRLLEPA